MVYTAELCVICLMVHTQSTVCGMDHKGFFFPVQGFTNQKETEDYDDLSDQ